MAPLIGQLSHQSPMMPVRRMVQVESLHHQLAAPQQAQILSLSLGDSDDEDEEEEEEEEEEDDDDNDEMDLRLKKDPFELSHTQAPPVVNREQVQRYSDLSSVGSVSTYIRDHMVLEPIIEQSDIPPSPRPTDDEDDNSSQLSTPEEDTQFQAFIERLLEGQLGPVPEAIKARQQRSPQPQLSPAPKHLPAPRTPSPSPPPLASSSKPASSPPFTLASKPLCNKPDGPDGEACDIPPEPTKVQVVEPTTKEIRPSSSMTNLSTTSMPLKTNSLTEKQATLVAALNMSSTQTHLNTRRSNQRLSIETTPPALRPSMIHVDASLKKPHSPDPPATPVMVTQALLSPPSATPFAPSSGPSSPMSPLTDNCSVTSTSKRGDSPLVIDNSHHSWSSHHRPPIPLMASLSHRTSKEELELLNDNATDVTGSIDDGYAHQRHPSTANRGVTFTSYKSCNDLFVARQAMQESPPVSGPTTATTPTAPTASASTGLLPTNIHPRPSVNRFPSLRSSASYSTLTSSMFQEPYQANQLHQSSAPPPPPQRRNPLMRASAPPLPAQIPHTPSMISLTSNAGPHPRDRPFSYAGGFQDSTTSLATTDTSATFMDTSKSRLSIASFSLTNDHDAIKTYRRMANKTHDKQVQMTYCKYLLQVASIYESKNNTSTDAKHNLAATERTRRRLMEEAEYWIEKLANHGHAEAMFIKGTWHATPRNSCVGDIYQVVNHDKAFKCFRGAAKRGWIDAHYQVAKYWKDRGDFKKTVASYKAAAHSGHVQANYKLSRVLLHGQLNQKVDIKEGLAYLKTAADADAQDSAQAAFDLSCVYADDLDTIGMKRDCLASRKNVTMAMHYLWKAQRSGWTQAYHQLGRVYELGLLDQPKDLALAFENYSKAAEDGHDQAMLALAHFYVTGLPILSIPVHPGLAFKWCERSANKGLASAEYTLGTYYEDGIGVEADYARALEYFGKAASKGYRPAAERLNLPEKSIIKKNSSPHKSRASTASSVECTIM
ncbi:HCP-like protein [Hesseltinella vesiculosa]|uniref:HCP-like protein n=1 Tax=Hesseltinella vesiculosa TaxID=101127 RepID=A0A1X2GQS4_9FUNG|nr:HCP-like protein [Hesseltinella vesiculosa]